MDTPSGAKNKVLIIEDDRFFMDLLAKRLSGVGLSLTFAGNGKTALELVDSTTPDIILLDILLPDMDGFEILTKIKAGAHKDIPVIFLSNLGSREQLEKAQALGAYKFMIKATVSLDNIVKEVQTVLKS